MTGPQLAAVLHAIVVVTLVGAYLVVTLTGADGNPLLGLLAGYAGGSGAERLATTRSPGG